MPLHHMKFSINDHRVTVPVSDTDDPMIALEHAMTVLQWQYPNATIEWVATETYD